MSKPDDVSQWAWEASLKPGKHAHRAYFAIDARAIIARAIQTAKAEAYEEAAKVAEQVGVPMVTHRPQLRMEMVPVEIAAAIRKLGSE